MHIATGALHVSGARGGRFDLGPVVPQYISFRQYLSYNINRSEK